jgi:hypothetical protein
MQLAPFIFLASCASYDYLFQSDRFEGLSSLTLDAGIEFERKNGSKETSYPYPVTLGTGKYPNAHNFTLAPPLIFWKNERPNFEIETQYFYTVPDSSVKVIVYRWDKISRGKKRVPDEWYKIFSRKFDELRLELDNRLGRPFYDEQYQTAGYGWSHDVKWKDNGLNAFLIFEGGKGIWLSLIIYYD